MERTVGSEKKELSREVAGKYEGIFKIIKKIQSMEGSQSFS